MGDWKRRSKNGPFSSDWGGGFHGSEVNKGGGLGKEEKVEKGKGAAGVVEKAETRSHKGLHVTRYIQDP